MVVFGWLYCSIHILSPLSFSPSLLPFLFLFFPTPFSISISLSLCLTSLLRLGWQVLLELQCPSSFYNLMLTNFSYDFTVYICVFISRLYKSILHQYFYYIIFIYYMYGEWLQRFMRAINVLLHAFEGQMTNCVIGYFLQLCKSQGLNSNRWALQQECVSTGLSCEPFLSILYQILCLMNPIESSADLESTCFNI